MSALLSSIDWEQAANIAGVVGAVVGVVGAIVAIAAAVSARKDANAANSVAERALAVETRPLLSTAAPPTVTEDGSGVMTVTLTLENEGKGHARVLSYAVTDDAVHPTEVLRYEVLKENPAPELVAHAVAPDTHKPFMLAVEPGQGQWFRQVVRDHRAWAFEVNYTDMNGGQRTRSTFEVEPTLDRTRWQLGSPLHLVA